MKNIIYSYRFLSELDKIFDYIFDKKQDFFATQKYIKNLKDEIDSIAFMPYKNRPSSKLNDENIRDFIYEKYTIVYKIYEKEILILGIFSQNEWEL